MRDDENTKARLSKAIAQSGLTDAEISRRTGIHANNVGRYRKGSEEPKLETFAKLCTCLEVSSDYVLGLRDAEFGLFLDESRLGISRAKTREELSAIIERDDPVLWPFFAEMRPGMRSSTIQEINRHSANIVKALRKVAPDIATAWGGLLDAFERHRKRKT